MIDASLKTDASHSLHMQTTNIHIIMGQQTSIMLRLPLCVNHCGYISSCISLQHDKMKVFCCLCSSEIWNI